MVSPWLCPGGWDIRASCVTQWGSQHRMYTVITVSTSFVTFLNINKKFVRTGFYSFLLSFYYFIQHCFFCRPSDSTESEDAGTVPRTVATSALAVRCSNHLIKQTNRKMCEDFKLQTWRLKKIVVKRNFSLLFEYSHLNISYITI